MVWKVNPGGTTVILSIVPGIADCSAGDFLFYRKALQQ